MTWAEEHIWQLIWGGITVGSIWMSLVIRWAIRQ